MVIALILKWLSVSGMVFYLWWRPAFFCLWHSGGPEVCKWWNPHFKLFGFWNLILSFLCAKSRRCHSRMRYDDHGIACADGRERRCHLSDLQPSILWPGRVNGRIHPLHGQPKRLAQSNLSPGRRKIYQSSPVLRPDPPLLLLPHHRLFRWVKSTDSLCAHHLDKQCFSLTRPDSEIVGCRSFVVWSYRRHHKYSRPSGHPDAQVQGKEISDHLSAFQ